MKVVINPEAIDELMHTKKMKEMLREKGERVMHQAINTSPDAPHLQAGYIDSFEVQMGEVDDKPVCWVVNTDFKAWWVEHGARAGGTTSVLNYRTLGRALEILRES